MIKYVMIIFFSVIFGFCIMAWERGHLITMDKKISDLKEKYDIVQNDNDECMYRISSIFATEKLDKIAKEKNFTAPKESEIINIK